MLYDRSYMQDPTGRRDFAVLKWLMIAIGAAFVVQHAAIAIVKAPALEFMADYFAVTRGGVNRGFVWTFLTYGFLHYDILHILLNVLCLYLFGRITLPLMGPQRFVGFFFGSMALAGLLWYLVYTTADLGGQLMGISGVCLGLFAVFATIFPDQPMSFVLIPITVKPKHAAWAIAGVSLFCMAVFEIPDRSDIAHSSHLGGMLAGWLYGRFVHQRTAGLALRPSIELPAWMRRRKRSAAVATPEYTVNVPPPPTNMRAEVDRILDKINSQGFGSLTDEERRILDEARDTLNRR